MRGLTIIVADVSSERFRTALSLATATAALGGRTRIFLQGEAVTLLRDPIMGRGDDAHADAGLPTLATHYAEALALGVRFTLCQSGLTLTATQPSDYEPTTEYAGLVSIMADLGDDRLVVV
ncbi:DsrE family protein [Sphingomonas montana]|uniref:DsrE family protein n=1 Tax=Sphingomonas montana TaxID=1843236 RepID=UPI0009FA6D66|nr:DsrE family protein [Sphingomonas montana]